MDPAALAAVAAAGVALLGQVVSWRKGSAEAHRTEVDAQGEIIDDLRDHIQLLKTELSPNGGLSLRDAIDRIERRLALIEVRLEIEDAA